MKLFIKILFLSIIRFFSGKKIIVSLTSYPVRYENLHLVIESLLRQKLRPSKIILYLYEGEAVWLPESLLELQSRKFNIVKVKDNIRPHKKYYYAFRDYPNDLIITVDDDFIYPSDLILNLYRKHLSFPNAIACGRSRKIAMDTEGKVMPYCNWPIYCNDREAKMNLVATGMGGVLYSPKLLDERVLDLDALKTMALNQDDLWLKVMETLKGTKTAPVSISWAEGKDLSYDGSLFATNELGENDICFHRLLEHYGISESTFQN